MSMLPELELIMVNEFDDLMGYDMFSRFHLEGKYENELLLLSPCRGKDGFPKAACFQRHYRIRFPEHRRTLYNTAEHE